MNLFRFIPETRKARIYFQFFWKIKFYFFKHKSKFHFIRIKVYCFIPYYCRSFFSLFIFIKQNLFIILILQLFLKNNSFFFSFSYSRFFSFIILFLLWRILRKITNKYWKNSMHFWSLFFALRFKNIFLCVLCKNNIEKNGAFSLTRYFVDK